MRLIDADALTKEFPCTCGCKNCGQGKDGILPCDIKDKIKEAPTVIDCGEMDHEQLGKIPYMDLRPQKWIPVEERLPENINLVLVTWENTNPESYYKSIKGKKFCGAGHYCNGKWFWESNTCQDYLAEYGKCDWDEMDKSIKVIAWMPLPNPYEVKNNDT